MISWREWKFLSEDQEKIARTHSCAIGRCSSYKNQHQDILPFDHTRVILNDTKDDYINASYISPNTPYAPYFIGLFNHLFVMLSLKIQTSLTATQIPLQSSLADFWLMVYQQQVNVLVTLTSPNEIEKVKIISFYLIYKLQFEWLNWL